MDQSATKQATGEGGHDRPPVRPSGPSVLPTVRDWQETQANQIVDGRIYTRAQLLTALREDRVGILTPKHGQKPWLIEVTLVIDTRARDPRVLDALERIAASFPQLGRRRLGITNGEAYRKALAWLDEAGLFYPWTAGELPRWNRHAAAPSVIRAHVERYRTQAPLSKRE